MFSLQQKRYIAAKIERLLLEIGHPEMPTEKPRFKLHVDGKESWSFADIAPNWVYDDGLSIPAVNPHNEMVALVAKPTMGKSKAIAKFFGDDTQLIESARALIKLDDADALIPHGIGGHARTLLTVLCNRLEDANKRK